MIDGLLLRLRSGTLVVRAGAAAALRHAGPPLAGRLEIALDLLFGATGTPGLVCDAVLALASVGRDRETVLDRVLELAGPRPRRWHNDENYPEAGYDEVMVERGAAIDALSYFTQFAGRVVPASARRSITSRRWTLTGATTASTGGFAMRSKLLVPTLLPPCRGLCSF